MATKCCFLERCLVEKGPEKTLFTREMSPTDLPCDHVTEQTQGRGWTIYYYGKDPPFLSLGVPPHTCQVHLAHRQRKDVSQCQRVVKREGIIYLKVIQT